MRRLMIWILLSVPVTLHANVIWAALVLETRLFSWWAVSIGLLVEWLFVRQLFQVTFRKAALAAIAANAFSAILGIPLIPLAGFVWELVPELLWFIEESVPALFDHIDLSAVNKIIRWCGTLVIACAVNVLLEGLFYKKVFKFDFLFRSGKFLWFMLANAASVGAAGASLIINQSFLLNPHAG